MAAPVKVKEKDTSIQNNIQKFKETGEKKYLKKLLGKENELKHLDIKDLELFPVNGIDIQDIVYKKVKELNYEVSDELLAYIYKVKDDKQAKDVLAIRYIDYVKKVVLQLRRKGLYNIGYETEDLIQSGYYGFLKSIKDFKIEMKKSFKIFVRNVVSRYITSLITTSQNTKMIALNTSYSYNSPINNDSEKTFEEIMKTDLFSPDEYVENVESFYEFWDILSESEKKVLIYYAEDYSYEEIGKIVFKDSAHKTVEQQIKAVDNSLYRITTKRDDFFK